MEAHIEEGDERLEILAVLATLAKNRPKDERINKEFIFSLQDQVCIHGKISKFQYFSLLKIYDLLA